MAGPLALLAAPGVASVVGSIGSTLLGGLFGKKKDKQENRLNLGQMVADAQANGFNPLTVLQATGGQGWSTQASSSDLDFGAMAAAAVVEGFGDYWSQAKERELMDAQIDLTRAQASTLTAEATQAPVGAIAPRKTGAFNGPPVRDVSPPTPMVAPYAVTGLGAEVSQDSAKAETGDYRVKEEGMKQSYRTWGLPAWLPSTAHMEELHGDLVGAAYGAITLPAASWQFGRKSRELVDEAFSKGGSFYVPPPSKAPRRGVSGDPAGTTYKPARSSRAPKGFY